MICINSGDSSGTVNVDIDHALEQRDRYPAGYGEIRAKSIKEAGTPVEIDVKQIP